MRTQINFGLLAISSLLFTGCTINEQSFSLEIHNGVTSCADANGRYNLAYHYEYTKINGQTPQYNKQVPLGQTQLRDVTTAADDDGDGNIDYVAVSISTTCDNSHSQDFVYHNQVPNGGTVKFSEDEHHQITSHIEGPDNSVSKATAAVQQVFGVKPAGKKSGR